MSGSFDKYAELYNHLYADKNYHAEVDYIHDLIQAHMPGATSIVEYGSGTGIHGRLLGEKGYKVSGIEPSDAMLKRATETKNFTISQGDLRESTKSGEMFEICLSLFHVFNYITSLEDQRSAFQNIRSQLRPGGIMLLEVWHGPAVESQKPELRVKEVEGEFGSIVRIAKPADISNSSVTVNYDVFYKPKDAKAYERFQEVHVLRPTYLADIETLCEEHNFTIIDSHEFLTKSPASLETWSVTYALRSGQ